MRLAPVIAGGLAIAAAGMAVAAFTTGGAATRRAAQPSAAATPAATPLGTHDGQAVWAEQGCGSCHTLAAANATGTLGPDLGQTLEGMPAAYIEESIVAPSKAAAAGYAVGAMPEDYASRMSADELERLVGFLRASAR